MKHHVEVFIAGCPLCDEALTTVREIVCDDCEVSIHNMQDEKAVERARQYGIHAVPAVVVNGKLADCCSRGPVNVNFLKTAIET